MAKKDNNSKSGKQASAREAKRARALDRQESYNALTIEEKLARIDGRRGISKKERSKLDAKAAATR